LHFTLADHYAAGQERSFTRNRIAMFEAQNPALQQKAAEQGTRAVTIQMAGRRPFDPYRDRILNGLSSGNEIEANSAIREWLEKVPAAERVAEFKKIKATINGNAPLKVGGSTKPEAVMEFLSWARSELPPGEGRRIFALTSTYAKTALASGLEERSKGMLMLAKLDYDKFKVPAVSVAQAARQQALAERQGQLMLQQYLRRQGVAKALQSP
jgi:hypothetical protein